MNNPWIVVITVVFVWWFSTGTILWRVRHADRLGHQAHLLSVFYALPLLFGGVYGMLVTADDTSVTGAYLAFLSALAVWGWFEVAFLSGVITGPNTEPCPPFSPMWERFLRATGTILWHELALIATLGAIVYATWGEPNEFGLWTFVILFFARISAKLNLFFGVPRIHTEFLPRPLSHLSSHFRHATMNWVFPVSITALSFAIACWLERAIAAPTDASLVGHMLLATLTALALLEHWSMVVPLPDQKLWRWMLPDPPAASRKTRVPPAIGTKTPEVLPTARN